MWRVEDAILLQLDWWTMADLVLPMQLLLPPALWARIREWCVAQKGALVMEPLGHPSPPSVSTFHAHWLEELRGKLRPSCYLQRMADGKAV